MTKDTICALCTSKGKGAISLIRISGPKALEITRKIAGFLPENPVSHHLYFGILKKEDELLDQVLISYFAEGRSFTGEESLEISCHGGDVYDDILRALLSSGARFAERGEFSLQAFANGKMDLVQAEGLLQFIESKNKITRKQAFLQIEGALSRRIQHIEKKWLFLLSHLEADIDFSLEGLHFLEDKKIKELVLELERELSDLISRYKPFENLQNGLVFGIFGQVNSGKSSLFNALLKEDKAIISNEPGTTRDLVEGQLFNPQGLNIYLKDSAGFRESQSEGERKGQERSRTLFNKADYRIVVLDSMNYRKQEQEEFLFKDPLKTLFVFTKQDLVKSDKSCRRLFVKEKAASPSPLKTFFVSSLNREGLSDLRREILSYGNIYHEDFFITNYRHYKSLKTMKKSLKKSQAILKKPEWERDLVALELRQGLQALYEILGRQIEDQILDRIFKQFCIGK